MQWLGVTVSSGVTPLESMGLGKTKYNGNLLLSICAEHKLVIINTIFRQSNKYKTAWKHPRSNHWHLLYYIIVRAQDRTNVHMFIIVILLCTMHLSRLDARPMYRQHFLCPIGTALSFTSGYIPSG